MYFLYMTFKYRGQDEREILQVPDSSMLITYDSVSPIDRIV